MFPIETLDLHRKIGNHISDHGALHAPEIVVELRRKEQAQVGKLADVPAAI